MWNYLVFPWVLARAGYAGAELLARQEMREWWRVLSVTWPEDVPAHDRVQQFCFGEVRLSERFDYFADMFQSAASHFVLDRKVFEG